MANLSTKDKLILGFFYSIIIIFIVLPLVSLISVNVRLFDVIRNNVVIEALLVSFRTTAVSMVIIFMIGIPAAYAIARLNFKGKGILDFLLNLPLVLPPAVAGLLLLITFGRNGFIGQYLFKLGIVIPFTSTAVIMAQLFVSLPMFVRTASEGFKNVSIQMEQTAMLLGDTKYQAFFRVTLPLAKSSILTGAIMSWARALAEFGATIMFAGNLMGRTQTIPLAIYSTMETDLNTSLNIARLMVLISVCLLIALYFISKRRQ